MIGNWFEVIPTGHHLPPPAADTNMTYALALIVIVAVHIFGFRESGARKYLKPFISPLHLIEEIVKPFSLALRLFGNIFAGGIILSLIGLMAAPVGVIPGVLWKLFGMAIGGIQAFIFALLTVLYFGFAVTGHGDDHQEDHQPSDKKSKKAKRVDKTYHSPSTTKFTKSTIHEHHERDHRLVGAKERHGNGRSKPRQCNQNCRSIHRWRTRPRWRRRRCGHR